MSLIRRYDDCVRTCEIPFTKRGVFYKRDRNGEIEDFNAETEDEDKLVEIPSRRHVDFLWKSEGSYYFLSF